MVLCAVSFRPLSVNRSMTIVYVNGKFTAQRRTGVQRVANCLMEALDARSDERSRWVLLCPQQGHPLSLSNIEVRRIGPRLPLHLWEQFVLPWAARDGRLLSLAGSGPWFARRPATMLHDAAVFDWPSAYQPAFVAWYRALFRRMAKRATPMLTVSTFSRERLAASLGVAQGRIAVVPNGGDHLDAITPDEGTLDRLGLRDKRYLLAVASVNPTKNLPSLVKAFAQLRPDATVRLVMVGGRNERVFENGAVDAGTPGIVQAGPLGDDALKALYLHATALVFPSLYEGFGLPPLEAMANGCPVVASWTASIPEVCGEAALYFDPRSVDSIAVAMQRVLDDEPLRHRLRDAGRERVAIFTWRQSADKLHAALQR